MRVTLIAALSVLLLTLCGCGTSPAARQEVDGSAGASLVVNGSGSISSGQLPTITLTGDTTGSGAGGSVATTTSELSSGGTVNVYTSSGNVQLFNSTTVDCGGATGALCLKNATSAPTGNPSSSVVLYPSGGELLSRSTGGATYTLAAPGTGTKNTQQAQARQALAMLRTASTTAATIYTSGAIGTSHVLTLEAVVQCIDTTALGSSAAAHVAASFVNNAGTVSQLGSSTSVANHNFTTAPSFAVSGTTALLKVTPNTADTTDCQAVVYFDND